ncbi:unnamed protein product [Camellia sinensis]
MVQINLQYISTILIYLLPAQTLLFLKLPIYPRLLIPSLSLSPSLFGSPKARVSTTIATVIIINFLEFYIDAAVFSFSLCFEPPWELSALFGGCNFKFLILQTLSWFFSIVWWLQFQVSNLTDPFMVFQHCLVVAISETVTSSRIKLASCPVRGFIGLLKAVPVCTVYVLPIPANKRALTRCKVNAFLPVSNPM